MGDKVSMQLIVNRGPKKNLVITTCACPVPETPEALVKLEEALKNAVPALIVQMEREMGRRKERVCPGCRRKDAH